MQARTINESELTVDRLIARKLELEGKVRELERRLVEDEDKDVICEVRALQADIQICQDGITWHAKRVRDARRKLKQVNRS